MNGSDNTKRMTAEKQKGGHVEELRGRGGRNARGHRDGLGGGRGVARTRAQQDFTLQALKILRL